MQYKWVDVHECTRFVSQEKLFILEKMLIREILIRGLSNRIPILNNGRPMNNCDVLDCGQISW